MRQKIKAEQYMRVRSSVWLARLRGGLASVALAGTVSALLIGLGGGALAAEGEDARALEREQAYEVMRTIYRGTFMAAAFINRQIAEASCANLGEKVANYETDAAAPDNGRDATFARMWLVAYHEQERCGAVPSKAIEYLKAKGAKGAFGALGRLGVLYRDGRGGAADHNKSKLYFRKFAIEIDRIPIKTEALIKELGQIFVSGETPSEVARFLRRIRHLETASGKENFEAALAMEAEAQSEAERKLAERWLDDAATRERYGPAHFLRGTRMFASAKTRSELEEAFGDINWAAQYGHVEAQIIMAENLTNGRYLIPNDIDAHRWYQFAQRNGAEVSARVGALERDMDPSRLDAAKNYYREERPHITFGLKENLAFPE